MVSFMKHYRRDGSMVNILMMMTTVRLKRALRIQALKALFPIFIVFCCNVLIESGQYQHML